MPLNSNKQLIIVFIFVFRKRTVTKILSLCPRPRNEKDDRRVKIVLVSRFLNIKKNHKEKKQKVSRVYKIFKDTECLSSVLPSW